MKRKKYDVLILNSNPWFSAISDYSLQLSLYLKKENQKVLYCAEKNSTKMDQKCAEFNIDFSYLPIHNQSVFNFIFSFLKTLKILFEQRQHLKYVIAIEGREHTILFLIKLMFPFLWKYVKLVRFRGHSKPIKNSFLTKMVNKYYTDKNIFAAKMIENCIPFSIPPSKKIICYYGKDFSQHPVLEKLINFKKYYLEDKLVFLNLGRFDPIKGHDILIQSFIRTPLRKKSLLLLVGKSEGLKSVDLFNKYKSSAAQFKSYENYFYLRFSNKEILIYDGFFTGIKELIQKSHFGIISSLGSEIICRVGVEFMQFGLPVIHSNAGALQEVFAPFPEFLWDTNRPETLDAQLIQAENLFYFKKPDYQSLRKFVKGYGESKFNSLVYQHIFDEAGH